MGTHEDRLPDLAGMDAPVGLWYKTSEMGEDAEMLDFVSAEELRWPQFRRGDCGVVRSVVPELQVDLPGFGQHDERAGHQSGVHDDSAMGAALHAGIREVVETVRPAHRRIVCGSRKPRSC